MLYCFLNSDNKERKYSTLFEAFTKCYTPLGKSPLWPQANEGDAFKYCSSAKFEVRFIICSVLCYSVLLVCGETKTLIKLREEKLYKKINTNKGVNVD